LFGHVFRSYFSRHLVMLQSPVVAPFLAVHLIMKFSHVASRVLSKKMCVFTTRQNSCARSFCFISRLIFAYMPVRCLCHRCKGAFVQPQVKHNHQRADLKNQTVNQQNVFRFFGSPTAPIAGPSSVSSAPPMRLHHAPAALPTPSDGPDLLDAYISHIE
jgi:hypothetical protein